MAQKAFDQQKLLDAQSAKKGKSKDFMSKTMKGEKGLWRNLS